MRWLYESETVARNVDRFAVKRTAIFIMANKTIAAKSVGDPSWRIRKTA
jgi:hypothetical protein